MTRIDIVSGFLGAGKTTLIKKLLKEVLGDTKVVLIENEFGEIGIDSGFLKEAGIEIKEMNSGCICCSLVGDFGASLKEVMNQYEPDRILIEPSGVGKLSDVMKAVQNAVDSKDVILNSAVAVVDASKCKLYLKNFGEFFVNQIAHAGTIILSRTESLAAEKLSKAIEMIREHNSKAVIITTPWDELDGKDILDTMEGAKDLEAQLMAEIRTQHDHECDCHQEHKQAPEQHHNHGDSCTCGCHGHHHHAEEVFKSWGIETTAVYTTGELENILKELEKEGVYGLVLRAKGMVQGQGGGWLYFDYVPGESNIRAGKPDVTGKICVIGSELQEERLPLLFNNKIS